MQKITESGETITIMLDYGPGLRLFLGLTGLLPLYGFYDLLIRPRWRLAEITLANFWLILIPLIIGFGCLLISFVFCGGAIFGRAENFAFDRRLRRITYTAPKHLFMPARRIECGFDDISLSVAEDINTDGPNTWNVVLRLPGLGKPRSIYFYTAKEEAEALCSRLLAPVNQTSI